MISDITNLKCSLSDAIGFVENKHKESGYS